MDKEKDPLGFDQHAPGAKLDSGKIYADQILRMFANALWKVCEVGTFGANKYTMGGWQHVPNGSVRYADAHMRHKLLEWKGELNDPDSQLEHLAHTAWNSLAELELYCRQKKNDVK